MDDKNKAKMRIAPGLVQISLTYKCQCNCKHCGVKHLSKKIKDELSFEKIKAIFEDLKTAGVKYVELFGGEPTLRKDIVDIVSLGSSYGFDMMLESNALLLDFDTLKKLKEAGLTRLYISMDDYKEKEHNDRRGKNVFSFAVKALNNSKKLGIEAHTSIVPEKREYFTKGEINKYIQFCLDNGASNVRILFPSYIGNFSDEKKIFCSFEDEVNLLGCIDPKFYDVVYVESDDTWVKSVLEGKEITCPAKKGLFCHVTSNGLVMPCPYLPLAFGDLTKESIVEVFARMKDHPHMKGGGIYCPTRDVDFLKGCLGSVNEDNPFKLVESLNKVDFGARCNNNCEGCVLVSKEKTKEEILDEISKIDKNYKSIYLYGGEIFTMKDIFEILDNIPKNFRINICSNARVFSYAGLVSKLKKYNINAIKVPFFPFNMDKFDRFTNVKEGFIQTVNGIKNLCTNGVPVSVYVPGEIDDRGLNFLISLGVSSISSYEKSDSDCLPDAALCFGKKIKKTKLLWLRK